MDTKQGRRGIAIARQAFGIIALVFGALLLLDGTIGLLTLDAEMIACFLSTSLALYLSAIIIEITAPDIGKNEGEADDNE